jgi:hypothetical protein
MKSLLLTILIALSTGPSWAGEKKQAFLLVTDVDDTIKITNMPNKLAALKNAIFTLKAFTGMSELYREMIVEDNFYVLSGGPGLWRPRIKSLLNKRNFPKPERIQMRNIFKEKTHEFKVRALSVLIEETQTPLILVGDDTEVDPQIFTEVSRLYPGFVLAIYIRQNLRKELPETVIPITTALDMSLAEHRAGRLTEEQVITVGKSILEEKKDVRIIPKFVVCPETFETNDGESELDRVVAEVGQRVESICSKRMKEGPRLTKGPSRSR